MAQFAKLGINGKVIEIHAVSDSVLLDGDGAAIEKLGIQFLTQFSHYPNWVQSFTDGTRKNAARVGGKFDDDRNAFISAKPFSSWTLNESTCRWQPPIALPSGGTLNPNMTVAVCNDGTEYDWNEETTAWDAKATVPF